MFLLYAQLILVCEFLYICMIDGLCPQNMNIEDFVQREVTFRGNVSLPCRILPGCSRAVWRRLDPRQHNEDLLEGECGVNPYNMNLCHLDATHALEIVDFRMDDTGCFECQCDNPLRRSYLPRTVAKFNLIGVCGMKVTTQGITTEFTNHIDETSTYVHPATVSEGDDVRIECQKGAALETNCTGVSNIAPASFRALLQHHLCQVQCVSVEKTHITTHIQCTVGIQFHVLYKKRPTTASPSPSTTVLAEVPATTSGFKVERPYTVTGSESGINEHDISTSKKPERYPDMELDKNNNVVVLLPLIMLVLVLLTIVIFLCCYLYAPVFNSDSYKSLRKQLSFMTRGNSQSSRDRNGEGEAHEIEGAIELEGAQDVELSTLPRRSPADLRRSLGEQPPIPITRNSCTYGMRFDEDSDMEEEDVMEICDNNNFLSKVCEDDYCSMNDHLFEDDLDGVDIRIQTRESGCRTIECNVLRRSYPLSSTEGFVTYHHVYDDEREVKPASTRRCISGHDCHSSDRKTEYNTVRRSDHGIDDTYQHILNEGTKMPTAPKNPSPKERDSRSKEPNVSRRLDSGIEDTEMEKCITCYNVFDSGTNSPKKYNSSHEHDSQGPRTGYAAVRRTDSGLGDIDTEGCAIDHQVFKDDRDATATPPSKVNSQQEYDLESRRSAAFKAKRKLELGYQETEAETMVVYQHMAGRCTGVTASSAREYKSPQKHDSEDEKAGYNSVRKSNSGKDMGGEGCVSYQLISNKCATAASTQRSTSLSKEELRDGNAEYNAVRRSDSDMAKEEFVTNQHISDKCGAAASTQNNNSLQKDDLKGKEAGYNIIHRSSLGVESMGSNESVTSKPTSDKCGTTTSTKMTNTQKDDDSVSNEAGYKIVNRSVAGSDINNSVTEKCVIPQPTFDKGESRSHKNKKNSHQENDMGRGRDRYDVVRRTDPGSLNEKWSAYLHVFDDDIDVIATPAEADDSSPQRCDSSKTWKENGVVEVNAQFEHVRSKALANPPGYARMIESSPPVTPTMDNKVEKKGETAQGDGSQNGLSTTSEGYARVIHK